MLLGESQSRGIFICYVIIKISRTDDLVQYSVFVKVKVFLSKDTMLWREKNKIKMQVKNVLCFSCLFLHLCLTVQIVI